MSGAIQSGRDLQGYDSRAGVTVDADVVVVGSGAGGAVIATELALAGQRVVVVEEGPHVPHQRYGKMRPSQSLRHLWRDGGMTAALGVGKSPTINVTMGRAVGGSSVLTGGVCFRTPEWVLDIWKNERGLTDMTPKGLEPCIEAVERAISVTQVPEHMRSRGTQLFGEGARKLGFELKSLKRNTVDCQGCGRCNFGCPKGAKMSVDLSYLPRAVAAGTQVLADCLVEKVLIEGDRATGVTGRVLNEFARPAGRFTVKAPRVVVAAGAYHSPKVLRASGVGRRSKQLGRNMTLHPSFRMLGLFDESVRGWAGSLQSAYSDAFEDEGITLVGLFVPPSVIGATMPGVGADHVRRARNMPRLAMFGGLLHDEGGGVVHRAPGREPFVTYRMTPKNRATIPKILRKMAETFRAAGAREIYLPILGAEPLAIDEFESFDFEGIPTSRLECASQHPLGSCRMGTEPNNSVVDPAGQVWGVRGLYVGDGGVVPTSLGVNPQQTVMTMATRIAWGMRADSR